MNLPLESNNGNNERHDVKRELRRVSGDSTIVKSSVSSRNERGSWPARIIDAFHRYVRPRPTSPTNIPFSGGFRPVRLAARIVFHGHTPRVEVGNSIWSVKGG